MGGSKQKYVMPGRPGERRLSQRIGARIEGRLVFAGVDTECLVHEMSETGAIVETMALPELDTEVALDVPGVGFARGQTVRYTPESFVCIELDTTAEMRRRFADRLIIAAIEHPAD